MVVRRMAFVASLHSLGAGVLIVSFAQSDGYPFGVRCRYAKHVALTALPNQHPKLDPRIHQDDKKIYYELNFSGYNKDEITVEIKDDILNFKAQKNLDQESLKNSKTAMILNMSRLFLSFRSG